jgi:hypothetical protein
MINNVINKSVKCKIYFKKQVFLGEWESSENKKESVKATSLGSIAVYIAACENHIAACENHNLL